MTMTAHNPVGDPGTQGQLVATDGIMCEHLAAFLWNQSLLLSLNKSKEIVKN